FDVASRLRPTWPEPFSRTAWTLATCADPSQRNPAQAVAAGLRAAELSGYGDPSVLDNLATAHAEAGEADSAIALWTRAVELAARLGNASLVRSVTARLEAYKTKVRDEGSDKGSLRRF
ncbi:MAG: hypothetical protein HY654_14030, partial [Acidobacteria bacterium]|nr:hypothetical protein [Acidobacteriota bacterium]